jgi:hypothetical protein
MCGRKTSVSDKYDCTGEKDQQDKLGSSNMILEQIDGTCYTFDSADCAMMFKRFNAVYGSNFADELQQKVLKLIVL